MAQSDTPCRTLPALIKGERRAGADRVGRAGPYPEAMFEAQRLGQPLQRRGLRGGPQVLTAAASAYLTAEFAGEADRRPAPGLIRVRKV